ncbi:transposase [Oxynema sp. CENA135]|uniref:IS110 family transposase n=1 Tax=Oxynema sp. CENA135 TaxID=984206 RepID=UPI00190DB071|nr:transposase [Oxynema sp. CENA135]MBK4731034.1 transposase [Oxynema sp. CENA135]
MNTDFLVMGVDVSAHRLDIFCSFSDFEVSPRDLYESPELDRFHLCLDMDIEAVERIAEMNPDVVVFEPTGPYSRFLASALEERGIAYTLCNQTMVKETRKSFAGTDNKDDAFDAVLLAWIYRERYLRVYDRRYWIKNRHASIKKLRDLLLRRKTLIKKRTAAINTAKQRLAQGEWIAKSRVQYKIGSGARDGTLPGFWAWVAGWTENREWSMGTSQATRFTNQHQAAKEKGEAREFSHETKSLARCICLLADSELSLKREIDSVLYSPIFHPYHKAFNRFGFGDDLRAWILCRVYPFEDFLDEKGRAIVQFTKGIKDPSTNKRTSKPRSKRRFKQALGVGRVSQSSGSSVRSGSKMKGSSDARSAIWLHLNTAYEMCLSQSGNRRKNIRFTDEPIRAKIEEYFVSRAFEPDSKGLKKKKGDALKAARNATCRKIAELVFSELLKDLGSGSDPDTH